MGLVDALGALGERQFRLLWAGQTFSNLGSALVPIALAFAVLDLTGSATDLGLVLLASRLSQMLLVAGLALAGPVAAWLGVAATLWLGAAWVLVGTGLVLAVPGIRRLRRVDLPREAVVPRP